MVTTKNSGGKARAWLLFCGLALFLCACQPPGPKALLDGERLIREGEYERALKRLNKAAELLPANAQVWNHIGLANHGLKKYPEAIRAYEQALRVDRNLSVAHFNMGSAFLELNRLQDAINRLTVFVTVQPDNSEGWLKLGTALLRAGQPDDAEGSFLNALRKAPKDPEIHNNLGLVHLQRKRPRDAMQCFNNALAHQADYAPAILNQAIVAHYHLGNKAGALERYQAYLSTKPAPANTPEIQTVVAELYEELNPKPVQVAAALPATNTPAATESANPATNQAVQVAQAKPPASTTNAAAAPGTKAAPARAEAPVEPAKTNVLVASNSKAPTPEPVAKTETKPAPKEEEKTREPEKKVEPEPQPEPEPEPVEVEVVTIDQDPLLQPVAPPRDVAANSAPAASTPAPEPAQTTASASAPEAERPLLVPRREFTKEEEESGLLEKVNPMRFFRRNRDAEQPTTVAAATQQPAPVPTAPPPQRVVPEEPAAPPPRQVNPMPQNLPRYDYRDDLQLRPGNRAEAERWFAQGVQAHTEKRYSPAMESYKRAIAADPTHFEANYNLGLAAYQMRDLRLALEANEQAVKANPRSLNARYNFALALRDANYALDAVNELRELLAHAPEEVRAHFAMANIYAQKLDQPALAERHYQQVLALQPNHPEAARIRQWLATPQ